MLVATTIVVNKLGIHARPSALLVSTASKFKSEVYFARDDLRVNGKSIMGVMMLAAEKGAEIRIEVDGSDEEQALKALLEVIQSGFGETD